MPKISGILIDGAGQPLPDTQIVLTALKTSSAVLNQAKALIATTTDSGAYSINAQIGYYDVTVIRNGFPPEKVGCINVYADSKSGTLNDYLLQPKESEITPEVLAQVVDERKKAQQAASNAKTSENNASSTLANAVKKTGDTITGGSLLIKAANSQRYGIQNNNGGDIVSIWGNPENGNASITFHKQGDGYSTGSIRFTKTTGGLNFENFENITISNKPVLKQGDGGVLDVGVKLNNLDDVNFASGFYRADGDTTGLFPGGEPSKEGACIFVKRNTVKGSQLYLSSATNKIYYRGFQDSKFSGWKEFITTANSTVDSNGFYKKASPVLQLHASEDIDVKEGFTRAGCGMVNNEALGVTAKRIDIGHYEVHGSLGFAKEGWYITLPEDANGNKKFFAEYSTDENNVITVKTYTRKFDFEKCAIVAGDAVDITDGRWIDLRLEMPKVEIDEQEDFIPSLLNPVIVDQLLK